MSEAWDSMALRAIRFVIIPVFGLLAFVGSAAAAEAIRTPANLYPIVSDARLGGDGTQTRFIADLSKKVELRAFTLADPYRVVIDIPQVAFRLPAKAGETGRGLVKAYRYGLVMQGGSRIVLDLHKPARIERAFVLDAAEGHPARIVLDLAVTDRDSFLNTLKQSPKPPAATSTLPDISRKADPAKAAVPPSKADPRPVVVLDPGHGGIDNGTRAASGESEKALVLDFA